MMAAEASDPDEAEMSPERLQIETSEKGLLAIAALVLAILALFPAIGGLGSIMDGRFDGLGPVYVILFLVSVAGVIFFGMAYQRLKRQL